MDMEQLNESIVSAMRIVSTLQRMRYYWDLNPAEIMSAIAVTMEYSNGVKAELESIYKFAEEADKQWDYTPAVVVD